jgi:hypothetical protein
VDEIVAGIRALGPKFTAYAEKALEETISGEDLAGELEDDENLTEVLENLGVENRPHRRKLVRTVQNWSRGREASLPPPPSSTIDLDAPPAAPPASKPRPSVRQRQTSVSAGIARTALAEWDSEMLATTIAQVGTSVQYQNIARAVREHGVNGSLLCANEEGATSDVRMLEEATGESLSGIPLTQLMLLFRDLRMEPDKEERMRKKALFRKEPEPEPAPTPEPAPMSVPPSEPEPAPAPAASAPNQRPFVLQKQKSVSAGIVRTALAEWSSEMLATTIEQIGTSVQYQNIARAVRKEGVDGSLLCANEEGATSDVRMLEEATGESLSGIPLQRLTLLFRKLRTNATEEERLRRLSTKPPPAPLETPMSPGADDLSSPSSERSTALQVVPGSSDALSNEADALSNEDASAVGSGTHRLNESVVQPVLDPVSFNTLLDEGKIPSGGPAGSSFEDASTLNAGTPESKETDDSIVTNDSSSLLWLSAAKDANSDAWRLNIDPDANKVMEDQGGRLTNIVGVVGNLRTGKSYLMNALTKTNVFGVSTQLESFTQGVMLSPTIQPLSQFHSNQLSVGDEAMTSMDLAFVDCEGHADKGAKHDIRLATPVLITAKVIILNVLSGAGPLEEEVLQRLQLMMAAAKTIATEEDRKNLFGVLHIVLRDCQHDSAKCKAIIFGREEEDATNGSNVEERNLIRESVTDSFESITVWCLPRINLIKDEFGKNHAPSDYRSNSEDCKLFDIFLRT